LFDNIILRFAAVAEPVDPLDALLAQGLGAVVADPDAADELLDRPYRLEHRIDAGDGTRVAVTETLSARSLLRAPRRAAIHLSGPVTVRSCWNIPVAQYDAGARDAARGLHSFTLDYIGFGDSTRPPDGSTIAPLDEVAPLRVALAYLQRLRKVTVGLDLVVESIGGGIATQLAADDVLVRSVVLSTIMYTGMSEVAASILLTDDYRAYLEGFTDGYLVTDGDYYAQFTAPSPPDVGEWFAATQPNRYPTGFFLRMYEGYPYFDPSMARAQGLVLPGPGDFVTPEGDAETLARDYGKDGAQLTMVEGGGHTPRFDTLDVVERYWQHVYDFIEA
jgi:pimeloyl-ACP methyl ester carboxylesterase